MFTDLLNSSYFALFLIVALGFMLGRIKIKGLSLDVSAVIFIALLFGHFGVIIPKELGNFGLVLFIFTIGIQAGPGFFDSFRSNGKSRRTGKRSGYESHHARRVDVEGIFQPRCREGGGADNEQGDDDEGLPFAPEGVEEAGTCSCH